MFSLIITICVACVLWRFSSNFRATLAHANLNTFVTCVPSTRILLINSFSPPPRQNYNKRDRERCLVSETCHFPFCAFFSVLSIFIIPSVFHFLRASLKDQVQPTCCAIHLGSINEDLRASKFVFFLYSRLRRHCHIASAQLRRLCTKIGLYVPFY